MAITPKRSIRIDDELWRAATETARKRRESVVDVIRRALIGYVEDHAERRAAAACGCNKPSEYLYADTDGWHCQNCNGLVVTSRG